MADYSGYTPQRQQQRQDPWADAAVGIAKLFMPDQEQQFKARQFQQTEELNTLRLKDHKTETAAREARTLYDNDRLAEAKLNRGLLEEKGRIMAEAARTGGLTQAQAGRLAEINSRLGGADSSVANIYKLTPDGQAAEKADAQAKADAAQAKIDAANKIKSDADAKAESDKVTAARTAADDKYFAGEIKNTKEYTPPNDVDLRNAVLAEIHAVTRGKTLDEKDINLIMRTARSKKLRGTAEEIAGEVVRAALGADAAGAADLTEASATPEEIEKENKVNPRSARDLANSRRLAPKAFDNLSALAAANPTAVIIEATREEIIAQTAALPPGTRVIWRDTTTGLHGGGMVPPPNWSFSPLQLPRTITPHLGPTGLPVGVMPPTNAARTGLPAGTVVGNHYGSPQIVPANDPRRSLGYFAAWQR